MILSISQQEFAESIGMTRTTLSHIEIGTQNPTLEHLLNIAKKYAIPYDYYFTDNKTIIGFVNNQLINHKKVIDPYNNITNSALTEEKSINNTSPCAFCKKNEEIIESQKDLINQLKENNALLKEKLKDCLDNQPPKRKVS